MGGKHPKAPAGCFWRGNTIHGRARIKGRLVTWSLHTDNPKIAAERRKAGKARMIADALHGDAVRSFVEVLDQWAKWIVREVSPNTAKRYACSLDQLRPCLDGKMLADIDAKLIAAIIRDRSMQGVTNATIKRDLVALSSLLNYCIDQGWRDDNPALPRMRRMKEKRDPIMLPTPNSVAMVIDRAPGMIADMVRAAIATGAREDELLKGRREQIDHERRQLTLIGKGNKLRVIELEPFGGYDLLCGLPAFVGKPLLFWHGAGAPYRNFASQFAAIVERTARFAREAGIEFRPFRFHDLRHLHAVTWLKDGRSIYDLQKRLGHSSVKVTEMYCAYLTPEEERVAKGQTASTRTTMPTLKVVTGGKQV
jgi:integrase/recombinase XerD